MPAPVPPVMVKDCSKETETVATGFTSGWPPHEAPMSTDSGVCVISEVGVTVTLAEVSGWPDELQVSVELQGSPGATSV